MNYHYDVLETKNSELSQKIKQLETILNETTEASETLRNQTMK